MTLNAWEIRSRTSRLPRFLPPLHIHQDITYLLCDWDGWRDSMGDCPIMREQLAAFAIHALVIHFFRGVLVKFASGH